jgi:transposase
LVTESNCDTYANEIAHEELRKAYPDGKEIIVIQDNASYNHAYAKTDRIKELNITSLFLPAYCPNLNLIERIWKFMKKKIMKNTYYPTFKDFFQAILSFCGNLEKYINEISNLMSQKFQIIKEA